MIGASSNSTEHHSRGLSTGHFNIKKPITRYF
jgi:hypothetical protein